MLMVFSMAHQAISLQIESGVDRIEDADEPTPTFTIDDAVMFTGAIVDVAVASGGAGYSSGGTIEASSGTGGFSATYTINGSEPLSPWWSPATETIPRFRRWSSTVAERRPLQPA